MIRPHYKKENMTAHFQKKSGSQIEFTLLITKEAIKKAEKKVIDEFRPHIAAKGFRKGSAPDEVIIASITQQRLSFETLEKAIEKEYRQFISENHLQPIQNPKLDLKDMKKDPAEVKVEVEVFPEVSLGNYKKIKMNPLKVDIKEEEIRRIIQKIMADMGIYTKVSRSAQKYDFLEVDFQGFDEKGGEIHNTKGEKVSFILGTGQFLETLENAFEGMKEGEEKKNVKVDFPKDYASQALAGKKVPFHIKLNQVRELNTEMLSEEDIFKIMGAKKTKEELKQDIQKMLEQKEETEQKKKNIALYNAELAKQVKVDLPESWILEEVEMRMQGIKNEEEYKKDPEHFWKLMGKKEEDVRKQFHRFAEDNLKVFLGLNEIIKQENIELDVDEEEKIAQMILLEKKRANWSKQQEMAALEKAKLNAKIDKYFEGLTLEKK